MAAPGQRRRLDAGVSEVTVAKAYRLLKAIMSTATDDGLIRRNPCRIKGASTEKSPERPVLTVRQVFDLAEAIDPRYKALAPRRTMVNCNPNCNPRYRAWRWKAILAA